MNPRVRPGHVPAGHVPAAAAPREVVLITGISGSGKSVALHALEDAGYYCVDNLPPELIVEFVQLEHSRRTQQVAIAVDVRSAQSLPHMPQVLERLRGAGVRIKLVFLDANTEALVRRFSETRRRHPLSIERPALAGAAGAPTRPSQGDEHHALIEAIQHERKLLAELRAAASVIDTSELRPAQLRSWIKSLVNAPAATMTVVFQSFAYKNGVPVDADYVFDVRVMPNPHYIRELRPQDGRDADVIEYLQAQPEVTEMLDQIEAFIARWLPAFEQDHRSYLTVAIGCTGGQHRSVYCTEQLARRFADRHVTLVRHRELDARDADSPIAS